MVPGRPHPVLPGDEASGLSAGRADCRGAEGALLSLARRLQSALLGGKGIIDIFDSQDDYDRIITLVWQGPISNARKPNPEDPAEYQYISVGARGKRLFVNDKEVTSLTPEALKIALVEAAKKPGKLKKS